MSKIIGNKGYLFAIMTMFMLLATILLTGSFITRQAKENAKIYSLLLGNKVFYTWEDVDEDIQNITELTVVTGMNEITFYDELPALGILETLGRYQSFINQRYRTPDLDVMFLNPSGNEMNLSDLQAKITINPLGMTYEYPDFGKNELFIKSSPENFSFVDSLNITLNLKNAVFDCDTSAGESSPNRCNKWSPDSRVSSCAGVQYCLKVNMTVVDSSMARYTYPDHFFDVGGSKKSTSNLPVKNSTGGYTIKIQFGPLDSNLVMDIDLHNVEVSSKIILYLTTANFEVEYLSKLLVNSSNFDTYKLGKI